MGRAQWALAFGVFLVGVVGVYFLGIQVAFSSLGSPGFLNQVRGRVVLSFETIVLHMRYMMSFGGPSLVVRCICTYTIF